MNLWKYIKIISLLLLTISMLFSCAVFEPASPAASYIHIDSIDLNTNYPSQGSNANKINDAWVIFDNKYLGTFPLPADIPLIGEGTHTISIKAGIIENGISGIRSAYPKYSAFDSTIVLSTTNTTKLNPVVAYGSGLQFPQLEDFEDASLSLVMTTAGTVPLVVTQLSDPNAFEGNSGKATLDGTNSIFEVASSNPFILPLNTPSYMELNYKGDASFNIGVYITTVNGIIKSDLLNVKETTVWKKIYVNLSDIGGVLSEGLNYKIYLHAEKPATLTTADVYFDNLKVVY